MSKPEQPNTVVSGVVMPWEEWFFKGQDRVPFADVTANAPHETGRNPLFPPGSRRQVRLVSNGFSFVLMDVQSGQAIGIIQNAKVDCILDGFTELTVTLLAAEIDVDGVFMPDAAPSPADDPEKPLINISLKASEVSFVTSEKNQVLVLKGGVGTAEDMEMLQRVLQTSTGIFPRVVSLDPGQTLEAVSEAEMNAIGWYRKGSEGDSDV